MLLKVYSRVEKFEVGVGQVESPYKDESSHITDMLANEDESDFCTHTWSCQTSIGIDA
jgi:hypothetical protein